MANTKVQSEQIEDGSITADKLADGTIVAAELADNAVETAAINADAVTGAKIADNAIDSEHYTDGSIDTAHIADSQITVGKMAANSVDSDQYVDGSIDTVHIADLQVTTAKIANGNISTAKIADNAVTSAKIDTNIDIAGTFDVTGATTLDSTLSVAGDLTASSDIIIDNSSGDPFLKLKTSAQEYVIRIDQSDSEKFQIRDVTDSATRITLDGSGNVGIGTDSPRGVLDLGSGSGDGTLDNTPSNYQLVLEAAQSTTGDIGRNIAFVSGANNVSAAINAVDGGTGLTQDLMFATAASGTLSEVMRLDASGNVGIGTASPSKQLEIRNDTATTGQGGAELRLTRGDSSGAANDPIGTIEFYNTDADGAHVSSFIKGISQETYARQGALTFGVSQSNSTDATEAMRIDSSGNLLIGSTSVRTAPTFTQTLQVEGTGAADSSIGVIRNTNSVNPPYFIFGKSRGTSNGSNTIVQDGDNLGAIRWTAADGVDMNGIAAEIKVFSGATPASNDTPGILTFSTTTGGSATSTERMRILSDGKVGIGTTSPAALLHLTKAGNQTEADAHLTISGAGYRLVTFLDGTAAYMGQTSASRSLRFYSGAETAGVNLANGGTSFGTFSDERLKENIKDIGSVTDKIKDIRCVSFNRTDIEDSKETIGFIAQDFVGKFDQVLDKSKLKDGDEEEYYSIKYTETIPVLLKAIQEQQTIIEAQTTSINDLKTRIEALES